MMVPFERVVEVARQFCCDDSGQDLLEYALLTATVGLAGAAVWSAVAPALGTNYTSGLGSVNANWQSPEP
jgi:Flp pilus assembly pilin Flp